MNDFEKNLADLKKKAERISNVKLKFLIPRRIGKTFFIPILCVLLIIPLSFAVFRDLKSESSTSQNKEIPSIVLSPSPHAGSNSPTVSSTPSQAPAFYAYVDGTLYIDENYNGVRDSHEKGAMGRDIEVWKLDPLSTKTTVTTNDDGYYRAKVTVSGRYQVQVGNQTGDYQYPSGQIISFSKAGEIKRVDFALVPLGKRDPEIGPNDGIIQGLIFNDLNLNGAQDQGESGVHFYKINLSRTSDNSSIATTTSGDSGSFTFSNLPLTSYRIDLFNPTTQYTITKGTASITLSESHKIDNSAILGAKLNQ